MLDDFNLKQFTKKKNSQAQTYKDIWEAERKKLQLESDIRRKGNNSQQIQSSARKTKSSHS